MKVAKIGEASRKKDELNNSYINNTKEQLESKMETVVEKREALLSDKKEKLKVRGWKSGREEELHLFNEFVAFTLLRRLNCRRLKRHGRSWRSRGTRSGRPLRRNYGWLPRTVTRTSRRSSTD